MKSKQLGLFAAAVLGAATAAGSSQGAVQRADAAQLKQKISSILSRSAGRRTPARTTISEREVNAYLAYELAGELPAGVVEPSIAILGSRRVSGRAVVDLDGVRKSVNPTSPLDPLRYLTGRLPVSATGSVTATGGIAQFAFESADLAGVPIPKFVLQEIVAYYSRSPEFPSGISLDAPFALPAGIREIQVERGQAIVIQ